jgi:hypothetical protein
LSKRYAVVSCHVERPLDDRVWELFRRVQAARPGGFRIAALMRPPDRAAREAEDIWVERARCAARDGALGHHTHFVGPEHARPAEPSPAHAARVREEAAWLRGAGLTARLFCGGGWYSDVDVCRALAELGYADCTATAFRPSYLPPGAPRLGLVAPAWLRLDGSRLLELPTTHTLGMAARAALGSLGSPLVHVYFHDTDLLDRTRRLALLAALRIIGARRTPADLQELVEIVSSSAPEVPFAAVSA